MSKKYLDITWPFVQPVDVEGLGLTDYFQVPIKKKEKKRKKRKRKKKKKKDNKTTHGFEYDQQESFVWKVSAP